ncbi:MAG: hypothetical protein V2A79_20430 [Planctomycetota bacterium]
MFTPARCLFLGAAVASTAWVAVSTAYATPWTQPSGPGTHFAYSNGGDLYGWFGDPEVVGGIFSFSPTDFQASASGEDTMTLADTLSFDVQADPGWRFGLVRVEALGNYALTGTGANSVEVTQLLTVTENGVVDPRQWQGEWFADLDMPVTEGSGFWRGYDALDLGIPEPWAHEALHFEFSTDLLAISSAGGSAMIDLLPLASPPAPPLTISITMHEIPEPSSLAFLVLGGSVLLRRWR